MGQKFKKNLGSQMVQEIAERSFSAFEKLMFKEAKKLDLKPMASSILYVKRKYNRF